MRYDPLVRICKYKRFKSLFSRNKFSREIAEKISAASPKLVLFCDDGIISSQTHIALGKACDTVMFIHDIKPHPAGFALYDYAKSRLESRFRTMAMTRAARIILLSENSYRMFTEIYPAYKDKALWMPLGAHIPEAEPRRPAELDASAGSGYYLFFGRISKYKGIINLLKAYCAIAGEKPPLVIAVRENCSRKKRR
jgi:glycosyltransferase involved in cell wall biosynthesis